MESNTIKRKSDVISKDEIDSNPKRIADRVANHYNNIQEAGLKERLKSRIFHMRNFNNWIKSIAINDALKRIRSLKGKNGEISVLDLCSGKGGDLLKWKNGEIDKLICADIAEVSVEQCVSRYEDMVSRVQRERCSKKLFEASQFIVADCTRRRLKDLYNQPDTLFDLTSCHFSFHYSFESREQTDTMLKNACECLRPGGLFIGTTPNANLMVKRLRASEGLSFGNDVYKISFDLEDKHDIPLFGAKYHFFLEGVVDCPEFLVYFPLLQKMAEKYDMKLLYCKTFSQFFSENINPENIALLKKMLALEPYNPKNPSDLLAGPSDYKHLFARLERLKTIQQQVSQTASEQKVPIDSEQQVGTLSKPEWDATSLYLVFAFQKNIVQVAPDNSTEG